MVRCGGTGTKIYLVSTPIGYVPWSAQSQQETMQSIVDRNHIYSQKFSTKIKNVFVYICFSPQRWGRRSIPVTVIKLRFCNIVPNATFLLSLGCLRFFRMVIEKLGYVLRHLPIYLRGLKFNIKLLSLRTKITEITYLRDMQPFLHHRHKPWFDRALYFPPFAHRCCSRPLVHWLVGDDWVVLHCPKS